MPQENTELPIHFEAKINPNKATVRDIKYIFVESDYAPATAEEVLMKNLLRQIGADYKTENVVIAINGYEIETKPDNQKNYTGFAEVKIDENDWEKIEFNVFLNEENSAMKIQYTVKK